MAGLARQAGQNAIEISEVTEIVERVARACHQAVEETMPARCRQRWDDITDLAKACMFVRARAAIEAMREPNGAMIDAGRVADENEPCGNLRPEVTFHAMIDAALAEPKTPSTEQGLAAG